MEFKASLGNTSKIITVVVSLLMLVIVIIAFVDLSNKVWWLAAFALLFILTILGGWAYSIKSYEIKDNMLFIKRPIGSRQFSLHFLKKVERIPRKDLWMSFRLFGSGGFFGYYGRFYNMNYGSMRMFATNLNNAVMLTLNDGRKIVVTPDEPQNFIDALTSNINARLIRRY